jgi:photoactive yellow protein
MEIEQLEKLEQMTPAEMDELPFGMIKLAHDGTIIHYNATEGKIGHKNPTEVIGKNFFEDIAPCTKVAEFYGRFVDGVKAKHLHTTFPYRFVFTKQPPQNVMVTLFYSKGTNAVWVQVRRLKGE